MLPAHSLTHEPLTTPPPIGHRRARVIQAATIRASWRRDLVDRYRAGAPEAVMTALSDAFARMTEDGHLHPCDPRVAAEHFAFLVMGADLDRGTFTGERALAARVRERALLGANAFLRANAPDVRDGA